MRKKTMKINIKLLKKTIKTKKKNDNTKSEKKAKLMLCL